MTQSTDQKQNKTEPNEALRPLIEAFVESGRRTLQYQITKYSIKRYESFFFKWYYKKKLYKAILELRQFERDIAEK